jgi:hypothetical protein
MIYEDNLMIATLQRDMALQETKEGCLTFKVAGIYM